MKSEGTFCKGNIREDVPQRCSHRPFISLQRSISSLMKEEKEGVRTSKNEEEKEE